MPTPSSRSMTSDILTKFASINAVSCPVLDEPGCIAAEELSSVDKLRSSKCSRPVTPGFAVMASEEGASCVSPRGVALELVEHVEELDAGMVSFLLRVFAVDAGMVSLLLRVFAIDAGMVPVLISTFCSQPIGKSFIFTDLKFSCNDLYRLYRYLSMYRGPAPPGIRRSDGYISGQTVGLDRGYESVTPYVLKRETCGYVVATTPAL